MVVSCIALVWGIYRMVTLAKSLSEKMVERVMILLHIVAYLAVIIVNALSYVRYKRLRGYEISEICLLAVYSVCSVIFGLILN